MFRSPHRFTKILLPLCGTVAALVLAPDSPAATVERVTTGPGHIMFSAEPGEDNHLEVKDDGTDIVFQDNNTNLDPSGGCVQVDPEKVACPSAGIAQIYLLMGDGTNVVQTSSDLSHYIEGFAATKNTFTAIQAGPADMHGGPGADDLNGSSAKDTVDGGGGPDTLSGGAGEDTLSGGAGNDSLSPGTGPDIVEGQGDVDTVIYNRGDDEDVRVSLFDNVANDGELGEGDNVKSDVENIKGGDGDDTLTGSAGPNSIYGGDGHDTLYGGGGQDFLSGQKDGDNLFARPARTPAPAARAAT